MFNKIIGIVGKSNSGKSTLEKLINNETVEINGELLKLIHIVPYTSRPMRDGEVDGVDYFFKTDDELREMEQKQEFFEYRSYVISSDKTDDSKPNIWHYATRLKDIQDDVAYTAIITTDKITKFKRAFGDRFKLIYLNFDDVTLIGRAVNRELSQNPEKQNIPEMCRRFYSDYLDFSHIDTLFEDIDVLVLDRPNTPQKLVDQVVEWLNKGETNED